MESKLKNRGASEQGSPRAIHVDLSSRVRPGEPASKLRSDGGDKEYSLLALTYCLKKRPLGVGSRGITSSESSGSAGTNHPTRQDQLRSRSGHRRIFRPRQSRVDEKLSARTRRGPSGLEVDRADPQEWHSGRRVAAGERTGQPQGGVLSALLSNVYLHYTLDLWVERRFRSRVAYPGVG